MRVEGNPFAEEFELSFVFETAALVVVHVGYDLDEEEPGQPWPKREQGFEITDKGTGAGVFLIAEPVVLRILDQIRLWQEAERKPAERDVEKFFYGYLELHPYRILAQ